MKLIRQTKLHFRSEKSDKVYEVDLCEAGNGEFVVNFRYGRRGSLLREGTKTAFPESRARAEQIFDDLVAAKTRKGYQYSAETSALADLPSADTGSEDAADLDEPRLKAALRVIEVAARRAPPESLPRSKWRLSRAIWAAGAWKVSQAADAIAQLAMESDDAFLIWSSVWALGRCGSEAHIPALDAIAARPTADPSLRRIVLLAKLMLSDEAERQRLADNELAKLPPSVREAIEAQDKAALVVRTLENIQRGEAHARIGGQLFGVAVARPWVREAIHEVIVKLAPDERSMPFLRQIFKAAEMVMDVELYGALVKKLETAPSRGTARWNWQKQQMGRSPAFSIKTKTYFQRRFVRHLKRLGESGRPELFIPMATGVLLANDDRLQAPREELKREWYWDHETFEPHERLHYAPRYSRHHCFLWVLRGEGQTIQRWGAKSPRWWFVSNDARGFATRREEPFGELWDRAPDAVMHLLRHARSEEVQRFAVRVFRANPAFLGEVDNALVADLLNSWCEATAELGLELARARWDASAPDTDLLLAMFDARLADARALGSQWLDAVEHRLRDDISFLASMAFLKYSDTRDRARALAKTVRPSEEDQRRIVGLVIAALMRMSDPDDGAIAAHAMDFVLLLVSEGTLSGDIPRGGVLAEVRTEQVSALLSHPLEACQHFGVHLLLRRPSLEGLGDPILLAALSSEFASVRWLGMQLMERLSDAELAARKDIVAGFAISEHPEIRQAAPALIGRVVKEDAALGRELVERWYPLVLREEAYEGLHAELFALLTGALSGYLDAIPTGAFRRMLGLRYGHAQLLGFELLGRETRLEDEALEVVVDWGCNDLAALREMVREHFDARPERLSAQPGAMLPMLETDWEDTRAWAFAFCRDQIPEDAWDPEALIAICDSVKPRAQGFGREMITRRFREEDGPLYLKRLSEHPTVALQIFATNYLARFAADDVAALESLDPYFRAVLSMIGAGRVAKERVFAFLAREAAKDIEAARYVEGLIRRQVATVAVGDKATCIRILADLRRRWPKLPTGLTPEPTRVYNPEARQSSSR